ncbi:hypothetical protein LR48_Vigan09g193300 [Vigna angularis]|uniref:Uncharacterized protein n=1 Tax=Phaseolus angularis TaxID=3914 RepID=A0A0L9VF06_PHAAN|nr:hypothetical protein LR48_Vigan09g193300 [Vigna angularis]
MLRDVWYHEVPGDRTEDRPPNEVSGDRIEDRPPNEVPGDRIKDRPPNEVPGDRIKDRPPHEMPESSIGKTNAHITLTGQITNHCGSSKLTWFRGLHPSGSRGKSKLGKKIRR